MLFAIKFKRYNGNIIKLLARLKKLKCYLLINSKERKSEKQKLKRNLKT